MTNSSRLPEWRGESSIYRQKGTGTKIWYPCSHHLTQTIRQTHQAPPPPRDQHSSHWPLSPQQNNACSHTTKKLLRIWNVTKRLNLWMPGPKGFPVCITSPEPWSVSLTWSVLMLWMMGVFERPIYKTFFIMSFYARANLQGREESPWETTGAKLLDPITWTPGCVQRTCPNQPVAVIIDLFTQHINHVTTSVLPRCTHPHPDDPPREIGFPAHQRQCPSQLRPSPPITLQETGAPPPDVIQNPQMTHLEFFLYIYIYFYLLF